MDGLAVGVLVDGLAVVGVAVDGWLDGWLDGLAVGVLVDGMGVVGLAVVGLAVDGWLDGLAVDGCGVG